MARTLSAEISPRQIAAVRKRFDNNRGKPLQVRLGIATRKAADLMRTPVRAGAPARTGAFRRSVKSRTIKPVGPLEVAGASVGPSVWYKLMVIRGHRIVTPGGRYLGRSTRGNDFMDVVKRQRQPEIVEIIRKAAFV